MEIVREKERERQRDCVCGVCGCQCLVCVCVVCVCVCVCVYSIYIYIYKNNFFFLLKTEACNNGYLNVKSQNECKTITKEVYLNPNTNFQHRFSPVNSPSDFQ